MHRFLPLLLVLALTGCTLPDRAFVEAVDKSWQAVGPEYRAYLEADGTLDDATRAQRLGTATGFSMLIERAKNAGAP